MKTILLHTFPYLFIHKKGKVFHFAFLFSSVRRGYFLFVLFLFCMLEFCRTAFEVEFGPLTLANVWQLLRNERHAKWHHMWLTKFHLSINWCLSLNYIDCKLLNLNWLSSYVIKNVFKFIVRVILDYTIFFLSFIFECFIINLFRFNKCSAKDITSEYEELWCCRNRLISVRTYSLKSFHFLLVTSCNVTFMTFGSDGGGNFLILHIHQMNYVWLLVDSATSNM